MRDVAGEIEIAQLLCCVVPSKEVNDTFAANLGATAKIEVAEVCSVGNCLKGLVCDARVVDVKVCETWEVRKEIFKCRAR